MRNRFGLSILAFIFALAAIAADAKIWSADNIPMVHLQDHNRYVCDPENILTPASRDSSDFYLKRLHLECGVQTVFVVVGNVKNQDCFRLAEDLGNQYGVGTSKERRGLIIVIAVNDRRYFIAPGKGLEADLTDVECDDIARACIVKNMKVGDTDLAVFETSKAIFNKLSTGSTGIKQIDQSEETSLTDWLVIIFLLLIFFGRPVLLIICSILEKMGIIKPSPRKKRHRRKDNDDWFPPFIFGGGGDWGGGSSGGSFGGGSFGGGGAGGGW
ncbi:TPM domain-containing protein [Hallella colorans]|uniref:TPM domain-containing protein n=1 Tax=Hallella colorans TaxID=1703337 RepID=UPI0023F0FF28|nr:TPM domain-containing protein [Hallella colorans]